MSKKVLTQADRLQRIETLLEENVIPTLKSLESKVADYDRMKHRGAGILVGLSLAFTLIGTLMSSWVRDTIRTIF